MMNFLISNAYAQATAPTGASNPLSSMLVMVALIGVMFFLMIRPQMKRAKEQRAMLSALAKGDEVITTGGLLGQVVAINDSFVTLEIADKVQIRLQKQAITAVLPKGTLKSV